MTQLPIHVEDPLGALLQVAGAHQILQRWWRGAGINGLVATGRRTSDPTKAWFAVRAGVTASERRRLVAGGYAARNEFRAIRDGDGRLTIGIQQFVDPFTVSPADLMTMSRTLGIRAQQLRTTARATRVVERMEAVLGQTAPFLPRLDEVSEVSDDGDDLWVSTGRGALTTASWEQIAGRLRNGAPDGLRLHRQGRAISLAGAANAATFLIEDEPEPGRTTLFEHAARVFWFRQDPLASDRLREMDARGHRRLFHAEHTDAGSTLCVFDPWLGGLREHPRLTFLWRRLVEDRTEAARDALGTAVWLYNARLGDWGGPEAANGM